MTAKSEPIPNFEIHASKLSLLLLTWCCLSGFGAFGAEPQPAAGKEEEATYALVVEYGAADTRESTDAESGLQLDDELKYARKSKSGFEFEFRHWTHFFEVLLVGRSVLKYANATLDKVGPLALPEITQRALDRIREAYIEYCKAFNCKVSDLATPRGRAFKVTYKDGVWFAIKRDPGVFEVVGRTLDVFNDSKEVKDRLQRDIFDFLATQGAKPSKLGNFFSAGHLNFDYETLFDVREFDRDRQLSYRERANLRMRLVRDFIVDFANHSELAEGILNNDRFNARSYAGSEAMRLNFAKFVDSVDAGIGDGSIKSDHQILEKLSEIAHLDRTNQDALNFRGGRMEIRSVRAQQDIAEFELLVKLFTGRVDFLKAQIKAGKPPVPLAAYDASRRTPAASILAYYDYVRGSGVPWADARKLLRWPFSTYDVGPGGQLIRPGVCVRAAANLAARLFRF